MMPRRSSIGRKFLLAMLAVAITGIALVSCILLTLGWHNLERTRIAQAQVIVDMIASNCAPAIVFDDEKVAAQILSGAAVDPNTRLAIVYTADGKVFATYPAAVPAATLPHAEPEHIVIRHGDLDAFADVTMSGKRIGSVFVRTDLASMRRQFLVYLWTTLACMAAATLAAFALARYLQGRIVQPILALYRTATAITVRRDFSLRAEKKTADEIGDLVDAFNTMVHDIELSHAKISGHAAELEQEVQERTARLRDLVTELETFSYTVSHDLRAPLRAIVGYGEAALDAASSSGDRDEYIARSVRAARRMDRLVTDILRYARLSKAELTLSAVNLDRVVHDVLTEYFQARQNGAEIKVRSPLGPVMGDEAALVQVFSNLVGNALKFVPPNQQPVVEIWAEDRDGMKRVFVRDNGIGIAPEQRHRLFRIFERLHPEQKFEGTGIGLSIVKRAVEKMDGTIGVDSEFQRGSTFWFDLRQPLRTDITAAATLSHPSP